MPFFNNSFNLNANLKGLHYNDIQFHSKFSLTVVA